MKFSVVREALIPVLDNIVKAVADDNSVVEACNHFLLSAELGGKLKIAATNLEFQFSQTVTATVELAGAVLIPARLFHHMVKTYTGEKLTVREGKDKKENPLLFTSCGRNRGRLKYMNAEEYPVLPTVDGQPVMVSSLMLQTLINQTSFAADRKGSERVLAGILVMMNADGLSFVATDKTRLSVKDYVVGELLQPGEERIGIVPARALETLVSVLPEEGEVGVTLGTNAARFQVGGLSFVVMLILGRYPEYERIIPDDWKYRLVFEQPALLAALRATRVFARKGLRQIKVFFPENDYPDCDVARFCSKDDRGDIAVSIDVKIKSKNPARGGIAGTDSQLRLDCKMLTDCIKVLQSDAAVVMELTRFVKPVVVRSEGDKRYLYVISPLEAKESVTPR